MRGRLLSVCVLAGLCSAIAGCTSEREKNIRKHEAMHRAIREADGGPVGEWHHVKPDE